MSGRRDSESFWPTSPSTPPTGPDGFWIDNPPANVDDGDWIPESVEFREDIGEAPVDPRGIVTPSGMVVRTHAAGVAKRAKTTIMKRPSAVTATQQALAVVNRPSAQQLGVEKRPGAISIMKRPASSTTPPATSASTSVTLPSTRTVPIGDTFKGMLIKMTYVKKKAIGIRLRGGRQLMQVQCNGAGPDLIDHWANLCIDKLESGIDVEAVKDWLSTQKTLVVDSLASDLSEQD
jgi:hypothetical protein